jgi:hypothetical protein
VLNAKVIVIEPSDSQARTLETLLRFLDLEPIHVRDLAEFRRYDLSKPHKVRSSSRICAAWNWRFR